MSPEQHARAKDLFLEAQKLDRSKVEDYLLAECPDDEIRAEVLSLLEFDRPETILMEAPAKALHVAQDPTSSARFRRKGNRLKLWAVLSFLAIVTLGVVTYRQVLSSTDQMVASQMTTLLHSTVSALEILFRNETDTIDRWSRRPDLISAAEGTREASLAKEDVRDALLATPAQGKLHRLLDPLVQQEEYLGFAFLSPSGRWLSGTDSIVGGAYWQAGPGSGVRVQGPGTPRESRPERRAGGEAHRARRIRQGNIPDSFQLPFDLGQVGSA